MWTNERTDVWNVMVGFCNFGESFKNKVSKEFEFDSSYVTVTQTCCCTNVVLFVMA
jgi:hypothetical protein